MKPTRTAAVLVFLAMLTPGAVAATAFTAPALVVDGRSVVEADATAFFSLVLEPAFTWEATASQVVIEREYKGYRDVRRPLDDGEGVFVYDAEPSRETLRFGDSRISLRSSEMGGALLVRVLRDSFQVDATTGAPLGVRIENDPSFDQGPRPDVQTEDPFGPDEIDYAIHETMRGEFLNLTASGGEYVLRGSFLVTPSRATYSLASAEGTYEGRTGEYETARTASVAEGRVERNVLILQDAVLRIRVPHEAYLITTDASVAFDGALGVLGQTDDSFLALLGLSPTDDGRWTGQATLDLTISDGLVGLAPPGGLTAAGAMKVARTPPALSWALGIFAVLAVAGSALALARRQRLHDDHIELALLAMEDRRWQDALPHLERALAKSPEDARLLVDRALCLEELGRLNEARVVYEAALTSQPFNAEAHYYYARTLARLRLSTTSLAHLSRALSLDLRLREMAKGERAFSEYRDHPQFMALLG